MTHLRSRVRIRWAGLLLGVVLCTPSFAQLVSQPVTQGTSIGDPSIGQTFVAPASTTIGSIGVKPAILNATANLLIYNGAGGSGVSGSRGTPVYSQTGITLVPGDPDSPFQNIALDTPFPVVAGQSYTFVFEEATGSGTVVFYFSLGTPDVFPTGDLVLLYADAAAGQDLTFQILEAPRPAAVAVPTLSAWSMLLTAAMLGGSALLVLRRRARA